LFFTSFSIIVLYSDNLKLSVEANITSFHLIFTASHARVGLMFHSAAENKVLSIDFLITDHFILRLTSSLIFGIKGNSLASIHFIFKFELDVVIFKLSFFNKAILTSSSFMREI
jgi:hypothetical protein